VWLVPEGCTAAATDNMNKWNIPKHLEEKIRARDQECVYCHTKFDNSSYKKRATWEHIDNNAKNISEKNIVLCCSSCNSSKGIKPLINWLSTIYCQRMKISKESVSPTVKESL
jgi:hypothetical protein